MAWASRPRFSSYLNPAAIAWATIAIALILSPSLPHAAQTFHVPTQYPTVQSAIDAASDGDEVVVAPGRYVENVAIGGKNIVLRSTAPTSASVVAQTLLDGGGNGSVVTFSGTEGTTCVLEGFTIARGWDLDRGGGIQGNGTRATIQYDLISSNTAGRDQVIPGFGGGHPGFGGGVSDCDGLIFRNEIVENQTYEAGGGGLHGCDGTILENVILLNWSKDGDGGGLSTCNGLIESNEISANHAYGDSYSQVATTEGGGLFRCNGRIKRNVISLNRAYMPPYSLNGERFVGQSWGGGLSQCKGVVEECTIEENEATYKGGGIVGSDLVQRNTIRNNTAYHGAGVAESGHILNNLIVGNAAQGVGGGIRFSSGWVIGNVIYGNRAGEYGGLCIPNTFNFTQNNVIFGNEADVYPQVNPDAPLSYNCIQDWDGSGVGNISADPRFVDPANGDFHLRPDSPCIDAGGYLVGTWINDFEGSVRPQAVLSTPGGDGSFFDIGAFEYPGVPVSNAFPPARYIKETILGYHPAFPNSDRNGQEGIDIGDFIFALGAE